MVWPDNPTLDQERWDLPLNSNLTAIKDAVDALDTRLDGDESTIASHTSSITTNTSDISSQGTRLTTAEKKLTSRTRGLLAPDPGSLRFSAIPGVMASPPTITPGTAGAGSTISGSVLIAMTSSAFRYLGCRAAVGTSYPNTILYSPTNIAAWDGSNTLYNPSPWGVEFDWYGQAFELYIKGTSAYYRLTVDGQGYDVRAGRNDYSSTGSLYHVKYDFGSVAFRRIRFDFTSNVYFGGIRIGPTDTLWLPSRPIGPKVAIIGDSFLGGSASIQEYNGFGEMLSWLMGWRDVLMSGAGGTGYLATNSGTRTTYRTRLQKDIIDHAPDIVIVSGGINDNAQTTAALQAEATLLYQAIRSGLPNAALIVSGMQWTNGDARTASLIQARDGIRAAAATYADLYIEQIGGTYPYPGVTTSYLDSGWMTGTGRVGATTGSGNSDIFRSSDATHPTQAGHDYRGFRHAQAIAAAMPVLGPS